jgi:hypothetical protein
MGPGDLFRKIALVGPALFFESAVPPSELAARFENLQQGTAREFLLLRTLAEVQKCGLASSRWAEARDLAKEEGRLGDLRVESLAVEQAAWLRRLVEALATLIAFQATNESPYYFHFLLLAEYDRERKQIQDEEKFFGRTSKRTLDREVAARARLEAAYDAVPDKQACWYLDASNRPRLTAFRNRYAFALHRATPAERAALGYTYQATFGEASGVVHYSVAAARDDRPSIHSAADAFCLMLSLGILSRAHELAGVKPRGINATLIGARRSLDGRPTPFLKRAAVGDFVVVEGPALGEVVEVQTSPFGYESYRVRGLAPSQANPIDDMWFPAPAIQMFMTFDELVSGLSTGIPDDVRAAAAFTKEEMAESAREAIQLMWKIAGPRLFTTLGAPTSGSAGEQEGTEPQPGDRR